MNTDKNQATLSPFGRLLRFWRATFEVSQEALALELGSSTRHISRMENGLAQPSREMVDRITVHFDLGERDAKQLLFAAGYTSIAQEADLWAPDMRWLRKAMAQSVAAFDPCPAFLTSGGAWILMFNRSWFEIFGRLLPGDSHGATRVSSIHYYDALFAGAKCAGQAESWLPSQFGLLMSLQQEAIVRGDGQLQSVVDDLVRQHPVPEDWRSKAVSLSPMVSFPVWIETADGVQRFNQVSMSVGQRGPTTFLAEPRLRLTALLRDNLTSIARPATDDLPECRMLCERVLVSDESSGDRTKSGDSSTLLS